MRRHPLLPLLVALAACGTPSTPADDAADREQIVAKIEQFNSAIREGDKQKYADVFVDDFVFTWSRNGQIYDRETILPNVVPTPDFNPVVDEVIVRIYGDSAIVNFRVSKDPQAAGARVTFSCARIEGEWKVLASHSTKIVTEEEGGEEAAQPEKAEILATLKGDSTRVVVVPSDGDGEDILVAYLVAWQEAGTMHVLPLDPGHPERAAGLFRLADVIELAGKGPHSVLLEPAVARALETARKAGKLVLE
jgi:hypothetical protein